MLGVGYLMRYVSTKNKSEKITLYSKCFLIRTGPLITKYHWIEINITFHLIYNTMFYSSWFLSYKGKTEPPLLQCCLSLNRSEFRVEYLQKQARYGHPVHSRNEIRPFAGFWTQVKGFRLSVRVEVIYLVISLTVVFCERWRK